MISEKKEIRPKGVVEVERERSACPDGSSSAALANPFWAIAGVAWVEAGVMNPLRVCGVDNLPNASRLATEQTADYQEHTPRIGGVHMCQTCFLSGIAL